MIGLLTKADEARSISAGGAWMHRAWPTVVALSVLFLLWPATLGGSFGLVSIAGHSMEPTYQLGEVVVTWKEPVDVGDVVLYRVPAGEPGEGNPVIHRVIGGDRTGWETQGDNMALPDPWYPTDSDVLGVAQLQVPIDARLFPIVRSWWFVALAGGLAVGLVMWPDDAESPVSARGRHRAGRS